MNDCSKIKNEKQKIGAFDGVWKAEGKILPVISPIDGEIIAEITTASAKDCDRVMAAAQKAFLVWREVPAPKRAEVVRLIGEAIRNNKEKIANLVTLEMGKTIGESLGEVQEMIDVCDFAVGLGRQIGGLTLPSERKDHRLIENWHPLGPIGVVTAFNFPVAVWSWNTALAMVCGDPVVWKPSSKAPLCAIACTEIASKVLTDAGYPAAVTSLVIGSGREIGDRLIADNRMSLISYTGSVATGRRIGQIVQERFGRPLLELGGNNAVIVTPNADIKAAVQAIFFGAVGTSGQRCTSTRRIVLHETIADNVVKYLVNAYSQVSIGDPRKENTLMGPLVDKSAVDTMMNALATIKEQGGRIIAGGKLLDFKGGCYVTPCIVEATKDMPMVSEETFAPIIYVLRYSGDVQHAIDINNGVPQGLSSAIFSNDLREVEKFISATGSDCGLANVNTGTSGAEIGGAFGGEKETGGGRESGSDSWKAYMRRQTTVINYSGGIVLAQGIKFDIG